MAFRYIYIYIHTAQSGLITNFLAGGLGVEDNRMDSAKLELIYMIFFVGLDQREILLMRNKNT